MPKAILCKSGVYLAIKCHEHGIHVFEAKRWNFNGNFEQVSIKPSVRHFIPDDKGGIKETICHYSILEGVIEYHGDNTHKFAGKKLTLLDFTEEEIKMFNSEGYK